MIEKRKTNDLFDAPNSQSMQKPVEGVSSELYVVSLYKGAIVLCER